MSPKLLKPSLVVLIVLPVLKIVSEQIIIVVPKLSTPLAYCSLNCPIQNQTY